MKNIKTFKIFEQSNADVENILNEGITQKTVDKVKYSIQFVQLMEDEGLTPSDILEAYHKLKNLTFPSQEKLYNKLLANDKNEGIDIAKLFILKNMYNVYKIKI